MTPEPTSLASALWPHQVEAVKMAANYLTSWSESQAGAALVTMPPGTGKTAVIAGIIDGGRPRRHWLVVVPRSALVRQVRRLLDVDLWKQLERPRPPDFPVVRGLPPAARIDELKSTATATVFVGTFQKLLKIDAELAGDAARRGECFSEFNGVLVDEGHYEPSPQWSNTVRALGLPSVLFTATPYRNDELHFDSDPEHRFRYPYYQAVDDGRLRVPQFVTLPDGSTDEFIDSTIAFVKQKRLGSARVIIRCRDKRAIRACVTALRQRGQSVVGIHETFGNGVDPDLTDRVPAPHDTDAQYWVHQFMLIEGIDDPTFRAVAFHDPLGSDRAVIQQIGRVLRRPRASSKTAWALSRNGFDVAIAWQHYLQFDRVEGDSRATSPEFADALLDAQPLAAYYDKHFRSRIDLKDPELWRQFAYQPAARVYRLPNQRPSCKELGEAIAEDYRLMGRTIQAPMFPDPNTVVLGYVRIANSGALLTGLFLEGELGYTVMRMTDTRLFVFDTHNHVPDEIVKRMRLRREDRSSLSALLDGNTRLTSVSLDNTDIGRRAVRSRMVRAASISDVAPELTDYAYVCNVAEGYTPNSSLGSNTRRYLGISRSRIRDGRGQRLDFDQYSRWIDTIDQLLDDDDVEPMPTLGRYADSTVAPADPAPGHVLLDIDPAEYRRDDDAGATEELDIDDLAANIDGDGRFVMQVNGKPVNATLQWDPNRSRYSFESAALRKLNFRNEITNRELVAAINGDQLLRIVPRAGESIYVHGQFIAVVEPHTGRPGQQLLKLITGIDELDSTITEKGTPKRNRWASQSVFEVVDLLARPQERLKIPAMAQYFANLEILVCTDLRTEPCDFIAVQPDRIAFIHAKYGEGKKRSASVFHDVVGQALKNILFLMPSTQSAPRIDYWDEPWRAEKDEKATVTRLRKPKNLRSNEIWKQVREVVTDPSAQKEVWIVLGDGMSLSAVRKEVESDHPSDEMIQIFALLQTAWSTAAQCGVQLRIFCSP